MWRHRRPSSNEDRGETMNSSQAPRDKYARCEEGRAPLDRQQRYCINCGARRGDAANPTSRYFAAASRRRRALGTRPAGTRSVASRAAIVGFFVFLPVAVAAGVLVGRSGMNSDNGAVQEALNALRNQPAPPAASASGTSTPVSDTSKLLPSGWSMDKGYTVKLDLLPIDGTDQQAASQATSDAESKGAKDVGIISPKDFATTPDQGAKDYVLYSGEFQTKADATRAVGGLKKDFSQAQVVEVEAAGTGGGGSQVNSKVVAHTSHGTLHS